MVPGKPDVSPESLVECASPRLPSRRCHDHLLTCSAPDCDRTMPRGFAENAVTKQALRSHRGECAPTPLRLGWGANGVSPTLF
jgi:hypothetical protein